MNSRGPKQVRCAIYTRVSTDQGLEQDFNSLDAQYDASQAYIRSQAHAGWTLIRSKYDDGGFSGGNVDRPALRNFSHVYAYCYRSAAEVRRMAAGESDPKRKQEYLEHEARWLRLAANSEFSEHLNWWIGHFSAGRPSIPA